MFQELKCFRILTKQRFWLGRGQMNFTTITQINHSELINKTCVYLFVI